MVLRLIIAAFVAVVGVVVAPRGLSAQTSSAVSALFDRHLASLTTLVSQSISADVYRSTLFPRCRCWRVRAHGQRHAVATRDGAGVTRVGLTASAFYGEGGVRCLQRLTQLSALTWRVRRHRSSGHRGERSWFDDGCSHPCGLNHVDTRDPVVGAGGGILMQAGRLNIDLGYRYKRIIANSALSSLLSIGQQLQSHQVRFGAGVRF